MTEQEKAHGRYVIVGALVAMFALLAVMMIIRLSGPMTPIAAEHGNTAMVRWGNTFNPFVYRVVDNTETLFVPGDGWYRISENHIHRTNRFVNTGIEGADIVWEPLDELPPEAYRRRFEGEVLLEEYRKRNMPAATSGAAGEPRGTSP